MIIAVLVAIPVVALMGLRAARAGVLPGTVVEGVDLGGLSEGEAGLRLTALAAERTEATVVVERGDRRAEGRAADLGYEFDVEATLAAAMERGRQTNPVSALADHLRAFTSETAVEPVHGVDARAVRAWVNQISEDLAIPPREGQLRFTGALVEEVQPRAGEQVRVRALTSRVAATLRDGGGTVAAPVRPVEPATTAADVEEAREAAELALSGSITLQRDGSEVTLAPDDIGEVLRTVVVDRDGEASLELRLRRSRLVSALSEEGADAFDEEPKDADIVLDGGTPNVVEGRNGFAFDAEAAVEEIAGVLDEGGDRELEAPGDVVKADLTTAEARDLAVTEQVSSFTTHHNCCESRVTNIHRIADIIDGHLILPDETFSVNDFVGERTEAKGFVGGGAIFEGEFVEQVGGGVSQFATTLYNAAWFGGYDIPVSKRHSYYISRYPEGREATLNYPTVDLQITNTSPYGLVIDTSYTDTSITVTFWGQEWVDVESETGPRTNIQEPGVDYRENNELEKGESRVIQEAGTEGFDITVTRTLTFPDGRTEVDEVFTRYLPQDRIVERNT